MTEIVNRLVENIYQEKHELKKSFKEITSNISKLASESLSLEKRVAEIENPGLSINYSIKRLLSIGFKIIYQKSFHDILF